jgi:hypothetical protein
MSAVIRVTEPRKENDGQSTFVSYAIVSNVSIFFSFLFPPLDVLCPGLLTLTIENDGATAISRFRLAV